MCIHIYLHKCMNINIYVCYYPSYPHYYYAPTQY